MSKTSPKPRRAVDTLRFFVATQPLRSPGEANQRVALLHPPDDDTSGDGSMLAQSLLPFCFPLVPSGQPHGPGHPESNTALWTRSSLKQDDSQHTVICLLAPYPWFQPFHRTTEVLEHLLLSPEDSVNVVGLPPALPSSSQAAAFLHTVSLALNPPPPAGSVMRLDMPRRSDYNLKPIRALAIDVSPNSPVPPSLLTGADFTEVQVPPHPKGPTPADPRSPVVPLAQLLFVLPAPVLATLCASLLAERRIILTCKDLNTLSTATLAAAQILSPLRWHHVLLPIVPLAALDVLSSPIPYLVGLPADLKEAAPWNVMEDHILVDLDSGSITPPVGSPTSDSGRLPAWEDLTETFSIMMVHLKTADEYRANGTITKLMHEFLASSLGRYREFIKSPSQGPPRTPSNSMASSSTGIMRSPSTGAPRDAADSVPPTAQTPPSARTPSSAVDELAPVTPASQAESGSDVAWDEETIIRGNNGFRFYHSAFAASFAKKGNREFAAALIHTQMWQAFIRERMDMMQKPFVAMDAFETKAMEHAERGRGVTAAIMDSFTRVKEADARAVFSRWTKKGMSFGRKAAEKMGQGVQRAKGAIGKGLEGTEWSRLHSPRGSSHIQQSPGDSLTPDMSEPTVGLSRVHPPGQARHALMGDMHAAPGNGVTSSAAQAPVDTFVSPPRLNGGVDKQASVWNSPTIQEADDIGDVTARTAGLTLRQYSHSSSFPSGTELGKHSLVSSGHVEDELDDLPDLPARPSATGADGEELFFSDSSSGDLSKMI